MADACLLLFTKPASPGRVKTRLIAERTAAPPAGLSPEQAAELHQAFLEDLSSRLCLGSFDMALAWALDAGQELPASVHPAVRQEGADLGERLFRALKGASENYEVVGAVGSDHPELPAATVELGFTQLREGADVVLGPAEDGGFYFVGARRDCLREEIFAGIPWSTSSVLDATLGRCRDLALEVVLLERGTDVDTPADLAGLARRLEVADREPEECQVTCPRTTQLLRSWGWLTAHASNGTHG